MRYSIYAALKGSVSPCCDDVVQSDSMLWGVKAEIHDLLSLANAYGTSIMTAELSILFVYLWP